MPLINPVVLRPVQIKIVCIHLVAEFVQTVDLQISMDRMLQMVQLWIEFVESLLLVVTPIIQPIIVSIPEAIPEHVLYLLLIPLLGIKLTVDSEATVKPRLIQWPLIYNKENLLTTVYMVELKSLISNKKEKQRFLVDRVVKIKIKF